MGIRRNKKHWESAQNHVFCVPSVSFLPVLVVMSPQ